MFKTLISTFLAAAVLFAGASFAGQGQGCVGAGYKATKATETESSGGMSSMAGNETSVGGSSLTSGAGNETGLGLEGAIVQGTGTSEQ